MVPGQRSLDEPNMSDNTILMSVEDLINVALGSTEINVVNYKLIQTILHIFARQMRMLEQRVEIRMLDLKRDSSPEVMTTSKDRRQRSKELAPKKATDASREKGKSDREKYESKDNREQTEEREGSRDRERSAGEKDDKSVIEGRDVTRGKKQTPRGKKEELEIKRKEKQMEMGRPTELKDGTQETFTKASMGGERDDKEYNDSYRPKSKKREKDAKLDKEGGREVEDEQVAKERVVAKGMKGATASETSVIIKEVERKKEKVLVVEKGPTTRTSDARVRENIDVVTRSEFELLEEAVAGLQARAGPLPAPALPDNRALVQDLVKGSASLADTMQAMQVTARVQAAEQAITRMGDLLTELAASGALPQDFTHLVNELQYSSVDDFSLAGKPTKSLVSHKSVGIDVSTVGGGGVGSQSMTGRTPGARSRMSTAGAAAVSRQEMNSALQSLKDQLMKETQMLTAKATSIAENASVNTKIVCGKIEVAMSIDERVSTLHARVADYAEQLGGFDTGLSSQMQSFREQMYQLQVELGGGLQQLEMVNNNAESAAVMELTERYEGLVSELDQTLFAHRGLTDTQRKLAEELHSLVECVEMLREQKTDRDEVLDGLRDKADISRLAGLLTVQEFAAARLELEGRLESCHDKFDRQEKAWMVALRDLGAVTDNKADITQLLAAREDVETTLRALLDKQAKLERILGEPKTALLTRALSRDATCGACLQPALMEPCERAAGAPPPLPAARAHPPAAAAAPCAAEWQPPEPPDERTHVCHRWVGGSHTLLSDRTTREQAVPMDIQRATKKYTGYGADGRLYMLEEELQPCVECIWMEETAEAATPAHAGAGDQGADHQSETAQPLFHANEVA